MKKSYLQLSLYCFLVALAFSAKAQMGFGKLEEIEEVQKSPLIVMIEEPREKVLKKLKKHPRKGDVEDYKADLRIYNENIKTAVEKFWPYNKEGIQYKTYDEIKAMKKARVKGHAVLLCQSSKASTDGPGNVYANGLAWDKNIQEDFDDRRDAMFTSMTVNIIEDFEKGAVYVLPLFDVFPTRASLVFGIKSIKAYFDRRVSMKKDKVKGRDLMKLQEEEMKKRVQLLPSKTLLLREEWLEDKLTAAKFKEYYPYPFKICDKDFMDEVIMNSDAAYAYGVEMPVIISQSNRDIIIYMQYVFDAADAEPMAIVKPSTGSLMALSIINKAGSRNFTTKTAQKIVAQIKGKEGD
ncbi:MAG: hypothetical protein CRN43_06545 [Candidatus Nephrothrix sp. EaCA]|nr:MAG: hypothetical protein CRN43_06545 [Candidatus Nephrothrix sp. EaCA]